MIGKTDFNALLWIISCSDVVVAHDSGPMHLAILLQKKFWRFLVPRIQRKNFREIIRPVWLS